MSAGSIPCRRCGTRLSPMLRRQILFPDEADAILELLEGRLNVMTCPVCEETMPLLVPVGVANPDLPAYVVAAASESAVHQLERELRQETGQPVMLTSCPDYRSLHRIVLSWTDEFMRRATQPLVDDSPLQQTRDGIALHQTRLALLVRRAQRLGLLEPGLVTEPPLSVAEQREFVARLYVAQVEDVLGDLYDLVRDS